jgi:hypothetical protein
MRQISDQWQETKNVFNDNLIAFSVTSEEFPDEARHGGVVASHRRRGDVLSSRQQR